MRSGPPPTSSDRQLDASGCPCIGVNFKRDTAPQIPKNSKIFIFLKGKSCVQFETLKHLTIRDLTSYQSTAISLRNNIELNLILRTAESPQGKNGRYKSYLAKGRLRPPQGACDMSAAVERRVGLVRAYGRGPLCQPRCPQLYIASGPVDWQTHNS